MKKLLTLIFSTAILFPLFVAAQTIFNSNQVGSSPVNGYYLTTNGTVSTWSPVTGGSGGGSWSTSTAYSTVLNNFPNNVTDVVEIGGTGTSTAKFWYDPNSQIAYMSPGTKFGIGTSSPYVRLAVVGQTVSLFFTATSTVLPSTFPSASTTILTVGGNTFLTNLGQGWISTAGGKSALTSSTSPTINYFVSTSTTATSTMAFSLSMQNGVEEFATTTPGIENFTIGLNQLDLTANARADLRYPNHGGLRFCSTGVYLDGFCFQGFGALDTMYPGQGYLDFGSTQRYLPSAEMFFRRGDGDGSIRNVLTFSGPGTSTLAVFYPNVNVGIGTTSPYTALSVVGQVVGTTFTATGTTASTFPYASSTAMSATTFCFTGDICRTTWPSGGGSGTVGTGQPGQFGFYTNSGTSLAGSFYGYASSTNNVTVFGVGAGGQNATTSATLSNNSFFGTNAGAGVTTATQNTFLGSRSGQADTTGGANTFVGFLAGNVNTTGFENAGFGQSSLQTNTTGADNLGFGYNSLVANTTGQDNTGVGDYAGLGTIAGSANTFIGYRAGANLTTNGGNIIIGSGVQATSAAASSSLNIGNAIYGSNIYGSGALTSAPSANIQIGIGSTSPFATLSVQANNKDTNTMLFAIGSSTQSATSTLFSVSNVGLASTTNLILSGLGGTATRCLQVGVDGTVSANASACGSGGGGGSNSWATSTADSGTVLNNYSLNNTDIVEIGGNSTTTADDWFDPNVTLKSWQLTGNGTIVNGSLTLSSTTAVSTFAGINQFTGTSSFTGPVQLPPSSFPFNGGANLQWTDLPQNYGANGNTVQSYSAFADSLPMITVYGVADGLGNLNNTRVGIGTSTPMARLSVALNASDTNPFAFAIGSTTMASNGALSTSTYWVILNNFNTGIGTSSPYAALSVVGSSGVVAQIFTATGTNASTFKYASTTYISATTASTTNLVVSGLGGATTRCLQAGADGTVSANASACGSGSGVNNIGTSSLETAGQVPYWTTTSGNQALLASEATGTVTCTGLASCGAGSYVLGSNLTVSVPSQGVVTSGLAGQTAFYNVNGTTVIGTSTIFTAQSTNVGIGSTSPFSKLSIQANNGDSNVSLFSIGSSTQFSTTTLFTVSNIGAVGIDSTSSQALTVGPPGTTTNAFQVDTSAANANTGISIQSAAPAGNGTVIQEISPDANSALSIATKGTSNMLLKVNGTTKLTLNQNNLTLNPGALGSGAGDGVTITGSASTNITAATEQIDFNVNEAQTKQHTIGAPLVLERHTLFQAPTDSGKTYGTTIVTDATVDIQGPPIAGINASTTNAIGLNIETGTPLNASTTNAYNFSVVAPTGAINNFAASTSGRIVFGGLSTSGSGQALSLCQNASGELISDTATCIVSSKRYKMDISPLPSAINEVMQMTPVSFKYTPQFNGTLQTNPNFNGEQVGFIAEDMQKIDPRLIITNGNTSEAPGVPESVRYQNITAILAKAIQDVWGTVQNLVARVSGLETKLSAQQEEISQQQVAIDALNQRLNKLESK